MNVGVFDSVVSLFHDGLKAEAGCLILCAYDIEHLPGDRQVLH